MLLAVSKEECEKITSEYLSYCREVDTHINNHSSFEDSFLEINEDHPVGFCLKILLHLFYKKEKDYRSCIRFDNYQEYIDLYLIPPFQQVEGSHWNTYKNAPWNEEAKKLLNV